MAGGSIWTQERVILKATFGWGPVDQEDYNNATKDLKESIKILNVHL